MEEVTGEERKNAGKTGDKALTTSDTENAGKEIYVTPRGEWKERGRPKKEELRMRERASSTSILEFIRKDNGMESEIARFKRRREEKEKQDQENFKKSNKTNTMSTEVSAGEEEGRGEGTEKKEKEGDMIAILREIRREIGEVKEKISGLEDRWRLKEKKLEERLDKIEGRLVEVERRRENKDIEEEGSRIEEVASKVTEIIKKKQCNTENQKPNNADETRVEIVKLKRAIEERERKERRNNLVIRGLKREKKSLKETAEEFLEKEFGVKEGVKRIHVAGREGKEVIIAEMDSWERKQKIMSEKKKLGNRRIFVDHDMTAEERGVQRKLRE